MQIGFGDINLDLCVWVWEGGWVGAGGVALLSLRPESGRWDREYYGALECCDDADPLRM